MLPRKYPSCPHCGGLLEKDNDGYEDYLDCIGCARQFNMKLEPLRLSASEYKSRYGINLVSEYIHWKANELL